MNSLKNLSGQKKETKAKLKFKIPIFLGPPPASIAYILSGIREPISVVMPIQK